MVTSFSNLHKLPVGYQRCYRRLQELSERIGELRHAQQILDNERKECINKLEKEFKAHAGRKNLMRLNSSTVLERKVVKVATATIVRQGYQYSTWRTIQG